MLAMKEAQGQAWPRLRPQWIPSEEQRRREEASLAPQEKEKRGGTLVGCTLGTLVVFLLSKEQMSHCDKADASTASVPIIGTALSDVALVSVSARLHHQQRRGLNPSSWLRARQLFGGMRKEKGGEKSNDQTELRWQRWQRWRRWR